MSVHASWLFKTFFQVNECALTCSKGGFTIARQYNETCDLSANRLKETCAEVEVKPKLQPLGSNEFLQAGANSDAQALLGIEAHGFWGEEFECAPPPPPPHPPIFGLSLIFNPCELERHRQIH